MTTSSLAGRSEVFCEAAPPPGHPVTAVRSVVEAGEVDSRLLATARHLGTETYRDQSLTVF